MTPKKCIAWQASKMKFVSIEHGYPMKGECLKQIFPDKHIISYEPPKFNTRVLKGYLKNEAVNILLSFFSERDDATEEYKKEVKNLVEKYSIKYKPKTNSNDWQKVDNWQGGGYVCNYWCSEQTNYPVRRVEPDQDGRKPEPHYEDGTYGLYACCNCNARNIAHRKKLRYLFFVTRYCGLIEKYHGEYRITGYYELEKYLETPCKLQHHKIWKSPNHEAFTAIQRT